MLTFCWESGITHNFSAPHTPQKNGVVERKNRTLQDMSRKMLLSSGLAPTYWAKAVNIACYIINRAMPRPILDKNPFEIIKGTPPNISHLRTFALFNPAPRPHIPGARNLTGPGPPAMFPSVSPRPNTLTEVTWRYATAFVVLRSRTALRCA